MILCHLAGKRFLRLVLGLVFFLALFGLQTASAVGTTLAAGDIAFIGLNVDGDDDFAFVLLKDIAADTSLMISDMGWKDGTGFVSNIGDGEWMWSTSTALPKGTVVYCKTSDNGSLSDTSLATDHGTIAASISNGNVISYSGDQLFVYQGSQATPTFITGIHWNVETTSTSANWDNADITTKTSDLPDQLTNGVNAIWVYAPGPTENDDFMYDRANHITSGTAAQLRAAINNVSNWLYSDTVAFTIKEIDDFTVIVINTAPSLDANTGITVNEGSAGNVVTQVMLLVTDAEQAAADLKYTLTAAPANGTLYSGAAPLSLAGTKTFTQADINANAITYTHNGGETTADSFSFTVSDGDGGSIAQTTSSITVTPVNDAPQVSGVQIAGTAAFGQMLTGSYSYSDAEGDLEGSSVLQWYRADSAAGLNQAAISGAANSTYILAEADIGKCISFAVTPVALTGLSPGTAGQSGWTAQVEKADCETATGTAPVLSSKTASSITLTAVTGYEYIRVADGAAIATGSWQDGTLFSGLTGGTAYDFYQRVKETATHKPSAVSVKLAVTTYTVPAITTSSLPGGITGQAYSQTLAASGTTPITWSIASGSLPSGLTLTGDIITGTPTAAGAADFEVKAENVAGEDTRALQITVTDPIIPPTISTTSLPGGITGQAYSQTLSASGSAPITWTVYSGSLPSGLTLSTGGVLSGTPTAAGTAEFTVKAANGGGDDTQALSVVIADPTYTATLSPSAKTFPSAVESYGDQTVQQFTMKSTGTGQLTGLLAGVTGQFEINTALSDTGLAPGGSATVSVRPKTGLLPATYDGELRITGDNGLFVSAELHFTVTEAPTYTITADPATVSFGSLAEGYPPVSAKTVTITNTGNQDVTLSQPFALYYTVSTLSAFTLHPTETAVFTVAPIDGLSAGVWNETIGITADHGASAQTEAQFTCTTPIMYGILSGNGCSHILGSSGGGITIEIDAPFSGFLDFTLNGSVAGGWNYDLSEGSTVVTLHHDYLESLAPGSYTLRFRFADGYAQAGLTVFGGMPETGDNRSIVLLAMMAIFCAAGFALLLRKTRR